MDMKEDYQKYPITLIYCEDVLQYYKYNEEYLYKPGFCTNLLYGGFGFIKKKTSDIPKLFKDKG